jgi:hypothetical protein
MLCSSGVQSIGSGASEAKEHMDATSSELEVWDWGWAWLRAELGSKWSARMRSAN